MVERGAAALAPGREPARRLAAGERATPSRAASRSTWPSCWRRRANSLGARGEPVRLALDADLPALQRRPDPARARLRQPARERGRPRRGAAGPGPLAAGRAAAGGARRRPRAGDPRERARADLRALLPRRARRAAAAPGLGLAIARGFVEANGGEVEVESLPGQGTSFVVSFAAARRDGARSERRCRASSSATTSRRSCGR